MGTKHLTKSEFLSKVANYEANPTEWIFLGDKPCIIDFYAAWCGPCKTIAPILEDLAKEYDGQIDIYKIDTEAEQELAKAFGIRSIPSILFCPMNGAPQMAQGAMPKDSFKNVIADVLLKKIRMDKRIPITIELFYTLTCPNCKILQRMLDVVLPEFGDKFVLKRTMANAPLGMIKTMRLGIHAVPALLINNEIAFKQVPAKQELINKLNNY